MKINDSNMLQNITESNFHFSGVTVDRLGASEYTLVTLAIDMSSSVSGFKTELINSIKTILDTCKKSPRAENLLLRLITFNDQLYEEHGFLPLSDLTPEKYNNLTSPYGMTALYDATVSGIQSMSDYGLKLTEEDFDVNGILFVVTDGVNNRGNSTENDVKKAKETVKIKESMESLRTILIGVNTQHSEVKQYLNVFEVAGDFDQYIDIEKATSEQLAKLANFVSKSISAQSQALGTGGPSQALAF